MSESDLGPPRKSPNSANDGSSGGARRVGRLGSFLWDTLLVARFDLADSMRSLKAGLILLVFLAGSIGGTAIFLEVLQQVESAAASTLQVASVGKPGAMTGRLLESEQFLEVVTGLVGDQEVARQILTIPPLAMFFGWMGFACVPMLCVLISGGAIAGERASGSLRFSLVRTDRTAWAFGKLLGQGSLLLGGLFLSALGVWIFGFLRMANFAAVENGIWMLRFVVRIWFAGLPWLGVALGLSQVSRSAYLATGLGIVALALGGILRVAVQAPPVEELSPVLFGTLGELLPGNHDLDLWRPELERRGAAMAMLAALGLGAFSLGHHQFLRKDA